MRSIRKGSLKYVRSGSQFEQLFDLSTDPGELVNLIDDASYAAEVQRFRAHCRALDASQEHAGQNGPLPPGK